MVWSTGFFDKNVVGTANALTGGWGNAGGGITYFIMPAVLDSFVARGYSDGVAWRLTFIVPLIIVILTAVGMLLFCPDTPTGRWSERHLHTSENLHSHGVDDPAGAVGGTIVDLPGDVADRVRTNDPPSTKGEKEKELDPRPAANYDHEAAISRDEMLETARGEVVARPTLRESVRVVCSPQTAFHVSTYFCSFGGELAINAVLGAYYLKNFPHLGQTGASNWAAMFGFLNFVTRPAGGMVSDVLYRATGRSLWAKKALIGK
jgi:MFS transporter, NNP family, nitrate/nitrite transporter